MTRGGRRKDRDGPERRCIASGDSGPVDLLVRFVVSPDGEAVPDIAGKLPGRGAWLKADRDLVAKAVKRRLFSRAFRQQVSVASDLADRMDHLLTDRLVNLLSLARKAGQAVTGAEKVRAMITSGQAALLVQAHDGAPDGVSKLSRLAQHHETPDGAQIDRITVLGSAEMGLAFGREFAIHAALEAGGFASHVAREAARLSGLRHGLANGAGPRDGVSDEITVPGTPGIRPDAKTTDDGLVPTVGAEEQDD